jgi:DNA-directed RNA polymerase specialized sigma24 family protein
VAESTLTESFTEFYDRVQPKLERALVAALGTEVGVEAAADSLLYGWQHWERVGGMENPVGYLYQVGRSQARRYRRRSVVLPPVQVYPLPWVEPALPGALERLSEHQRAAVVLIHSLGWTNAEVAETFGVSIGTVQTHLRRGMRRLQRTLGGPT